MRLKSTVLIPGQDIRMIFLKLHNQTGPLGKKSCTPSLSLVKERQLYNAKNVYQTLFFRGTVSLVWSFMYVEIS